MSLHQPHFIHTLREVPKGVWILSLANMFINISTIIVFSYSPTYFTIVLGLSLTNFGMIEGFVEGLSWLMRIASGILSDFFKRRKILILLGYALIVLARPFFIFGRSVALVFSGRTLDRIANGLQASPREALTGDLSPPHIKGTCYGLRQAFGWAGSVIGSALGIYVMTHTHSYQMVFTISTIPAIIAVFIVGLMVQDVDPKTIKRDDNKNWHIRDIKRLPASYWIIIAVSAVYMLARFSESFILLWANKLGLEREYAPLVFIIINAGSALASYPIGFFSDRKDRRIFVGGGLLLLIAADIIYAFAASHLTVLASAALWGVQIGIVQSLLVTMVADRAPKDLRGTAFGIYFLIAGLAMMLASTTTGFLSHTFGFSAAFMVSGLFGTLAFCGLFFMRTTKSARK